MNCGQSCLKYLLFAFNLLFWILGLVVIGVGAYSRISSKNYDTLLGDGGVASASNILIASGAFVTVIGFLGCCGAIRESKCMLVMYFIMVLLIFILEIAAGAMAYAMKGAMEKGFTDTLTEVVNKNYNDQPNASVSQKEFTASLDWFQKEVKCCGARGIDDWLTSTWFKEQTDKFNLAPKSCCIVEVPGCQKIKLSLYRTGCVDAGVKFVNSHVMDVVKVAIGVAVVQLLVMISAICLCKAIGSEEEMA